MSTGFENKKSKTKASFGPSIDSKDITTKFQEYFTQIKDPRVERTRYHLLTDIITIAILGVIAGAEGWEDIAYLGVIRLEQMNTTEAMLHTYRAVEGLLYWWAVDSFPNDVKEINNQYPSVKSSILQQYPSLRSHFNQPEVDLRGWLLQDLLSAAIPTTVTSIDFQAFWNSARKTRNNFSHRLGGLEEKEVFRAWGDDIINSDQWKKRIINCINLVTGKSFTRLSQASILAQIHTQVMEAIAKYEIQT